jgi:hypothetical protein
MFYGVTVEASAVKFTWYIHCIFKSQALISLGGLILYIIERSRTLFTLHFYLLNKNK